MSLGSLLRNRTTVSATTVMVINFRDFVVAYSATLNDSVPGIAATLNIEASLMSEREFCHIHATYLIDTSTNTCFLVTASLRFQTKLNGDWNPCQPTDVPFEVVVPTVMYV